LYLPLRPELVETMTGKFMFGVGVNSDAGVLGSIIVDEQNFDWTRFPRSWEDIRNGTAWRGAGQKFRMEAMPGTQLQRYAISFTEPYLNVGSANLSESLSAFYYDRFYREWTERRTGGRVALGYQFLNDLWGTFAYRLEDVRISRPIVPHGYIPELDEVLGSNTLHGLRVQLTRDTRDNSFLPTEGYVLELGFEQVLGSFSYPRADLDARKYFLLRQHPDGSGRHVLSLSSRLAWSGSDTPIYEHFYAGGFSTIRGFEFRGVTPRKYGVGVGGEFSLLSSAEYLFPVTADDMLRGVVFCDTGTIQPSIDHCDQRYRVSVGFGMRIVIPAMGPAPIALDFAFPLVKEPGDQTQVFSFFVGWMR
jgi:outer membrane protein insertion porin family